MAGAAWSPQPHPGAGERYGAKLPCGGGGRAAVDRVTGEVYQDGTAAGSPEKWFGRTVLDVVESVPSSKGANDAVSLPGHPVYGVRAPNPRCVHRCGSFGGICQILSHM